MASSRSSSPRLPDRAPSPEEIVGLLADPVRRKITGALIDGPATVDELIARSGGPARQVVEQLGRLEAADVVTSDAGRFALVDEVFARSVRDAAAERLGPLNDPHTQLARRYLFRNRLVQIPSEPWALKAVLDLVAEDFQPGEVYSEREVNTILYGWHGDWASLRRLLVDGGYLSRRHGQYRRTDARLTPGSG
jgi:hypothetical protein